MLWGVLGVLLIVLISAFSRAFKTNQSLRQELDTLRPYLTSVVEEQATLKGELAYVQSDEYIEKWSRENAGMTKEDEILVVTVKTLETQAPIQTPSPTPDTPTQSPTEVPFWVKWWEALTNR